MVKTVYKTFVSLMSLVIDGRKSWKKLKSVLLYYLVLTTAQYEIFEFMMQCEKMQEIVKLAQGGLLFHILFLYSTILNLNLKVCTVKLGDKKWFDKEQIGVKESFPVTNLLHKDKEHLALTNNFRVTKKFLITKFDCNYTKCSLSPSLTV